MRNQTEALRPDARSSGQVLAPGSLISLSGGALRPATVRSGEFRESVAGRPEMLAHDARNLVSALFMFGELLAAPGVLSAGFAHYAADLTRLAATGARLVESLAMGAAGQRHQARPAAPPLEGPRPVAPPAFRRHPFPQIEDLGAELREMAGTLRALAGPEVRLEIDCMPCAGRLAIHAEDLFRILFNLIANAVEAVALTPPELRRRPLLRITAQRGGAASFLAGRHRARPETIVLSVRDNGPGIAAKDLPHIFEEGFSTRRATRRRETSEPGRPCGLGLAIVRQLVSSAGGEVRAISPRGLGARFDVELPVVAPAGPGPGRRPGTTPGKRKIAQVRQISAQIEKEA